MSTKVLMLKKYRKDGNVDVEPIVTVDDEAGLSANSVAYILTNETNRARKMAIGDDALTATEYVAGDLKYSG